MASGPDLTPFINALQHKSESASAGAARYMTAALQHVELMDNIRRAELKRQQEEEDEALLRGLALDTPMGKMDAYTLAKAGGGSAFEAVRSMVLTKSAMDREAANVKMIDALTLKLRNASNAVPVQAQLVEQMTARLGNATPVDPDAPAATPVDPGAPAAEKIGRNMTPRGPIKGLSADEIVRQYTRGFLVNQFGPLAADVKYMLNPVGPPAPPRFNRFGPTPPSRPFGIYSSGVEWGASHSPTNAVPLGRFPQ